MNERDPSKPEAVEQKTLPHPPPSPLAVTLSDTVSFHPSTPPPSPEMETVEVGRRFGDYELLQELGRGGMGVVFKARDLRLNRTVALKMILAGQFAGSEAVQRFHAEAEAAAHLDHPGIVPIYEVGERQGQHFFSMGYVDGVSLAQKVARGPLPQREAALLTRKIADAVAYAHERGIIHRDLKPANVLLSGEMDTPAAQCQPRITDFGLAKRVKGDSHLTGTGQILGTPSYMPPEQAEGRIEDVGPPSDVYSLGALLYCLLTGHPPFQAATVMETLMQVLNEDPVSPRRLNPSIDRDLETICLKALRKEREKRYASAQDLADDLDRFLSGEPILARPIGPIEWGVRWCVRHPRVAAVSGLMTLVLLLFFVNLSLALASVRIMSVRNQELLASSIAGRLDERLRGDMQAVRTLAAEAEVIEALTASPAQRAGLREKVCDSLTIICNSNSDFSAAFVLSATGELIASTNPVHYGQTFFSSRDYYREARAGTWFKSRIRIGSTTNKPGMYYSAPVKHKGDILGVVVIKMEATTIWRILDNLQEAVGPLGILFLADEDGIVIAHSDRNRLYHTLVPLTDDEMERLAIFDRFKRDTLPDLGIPELATLLSSRTSGTLTYTHPVDGSDRTVAYAPLDEKPWILAVDLDRQASIDPPGLRAGRQVVSASLIVCLLAIPLVLLAPRWRELLARLRPR